MNAARAAPQAVLLLPSPLLGLPSLELAVQAAFLLARRLVCDRRRRCAWARRHDNIFTVVRFCAGIFGGGCGLLGASAGRQPRRQLRLRLAALHSPAPLERAGLLLCFDVLPPCTSTQQRCPLVRLDGALGGGGPSSAARSAKEAGQCRGRPRSNVSAPPPFVIRVEDGILVAVHGDPLARTVVLLQQPLAPRSVRLLELLCRAKAPHHLGGEVRCQDQVHLGHTIQQGILTLIWYCNEWICKHGAAVPRSDRALTVLDEVAAILHPPELLELFVRLSEVLVGSSFDVDQTHDPVRVAQRFGPRRERVRDGRADWPAVRLRRVMAALRAGRSGAGRRGIALDAFLEPAVQGRGRALAVEGIDRRASAGRCRRPSGVVGVHGVGASPCTSTLEMDASTALWRYTAGYTSDPPYSIRELDMVYFVCSNERRAEGEFEDVEKADISPRNRCCNTASTKALGA